MQTVKFDLIRDLPNRSRIIAEVEIRGNDSDLSPAFSLCGSLYEAHGTWSGKAQHENGRDIDAGGQITDELSKAFPELQPFARLHSCDLDGVPMHAVSNGLYFYRYARGIHQRYGFDNKYGEAQREGFANPRDYARKVVRDLLRIESLADLDALPASMFAEGKDLAFARFVDAQRARWREEAESATALGINILERKAREILHTDNPNEPSGEWSAYDLSKSLHASLATTEAVLKLICPDGGRFVGGTSKYLYWLPAEASV